MFSFKIAGEGQNAERRHFIGLHISSSLRKLEASAISCESSRPNARIFLHKSASYDLPEEITTSYNELLEVVRTTQDATSFCETRQNKTSDRSERTPLKSVLKSAKGTISACALEKLALLREMIETIQEEAIREITSDSGISLSEIVAVALNDPGLWLKNAEWTPFATCYSLSDASLLASRSGLNVINNFIPSDWSPLGYGRPFLTIPYWILLANAEKGRLLLDLGETARWTYLPPSKTANAWQQSLYQEVVPCGAMLNLFTCQASKGEISIDAGGKLSVQGKRPEDLNEFWTDARNHALESLDISSRYYSTSGSGALNELFYMDALKAARPRKYSSLDALCASVYWIAEQVAESLDLQRGIDSYEVVLSGASRQNRLLFSRLSALLKTNEFHYLSEYGFLEDSFDSVAVAVLGILSIAGSQTSYSGMFGVKVTNPLGSISPGSNEAWKHLLAFARE